MNRRRVGKKGGVLRMGKYEFTKEQRECLERIAEEAAEGRGNTPGRKSGNDDASE